MTKEIENAITICLSQSDHSMDTCAEAAKIVAKALRDSMAELSRANEMLSVTTERAEKAEAECERLKDKVKSAHTKGMDDFRRCIVIMFEQKAASCDDTMLKEIIYAWVKFIQETRI